ncbi:glycosyltransferase [Brumimicrobium oceani]|uniref:Glycosyl transferase family 1 domain-containing protein n=1 Tax=Brumimicrobium oceani TaxID=2100725 RepID=A0A2U2XDL6_9FLAO|nr:glycosyltransferase [Brumimicrobium oceani]PWH85884.1 hypothetical protein DIT68_07255 [Brumimicrobium oceani]
MTKNNTHIAYFCPSLSWGGLEMNQLRNAEWMHNRGHKVVILLQKGSRIHQEASANGISVDFVQPHKKYFDFGKAAQLIKKIKQHNITHLIVRDPKDMSVCSLAKSWSKKKFFLAYFMEMQIGIPKRDLLHTIRYSSFDLWSCPLPWLKKQVKELTRFPSEKTLVIPSGLSLDRYFNAPERQEAKTLLDLDTNKEYIGLVGRFDEQKRQLLLLESFNQIKDKIHHDLVFLGESTHGESDAYFDKLKEYVRENKIEKRVHFRPFRPDVETFYSAIDVFVMATKSETFGMVTIEAMAAGCKVVGSNQGGTVEILNHGEFGELFETGNAEDLSNKLMVSIANQDFDANAVKDEARKYDAEIVCNKVETALGI